MSAAAMEAEGEDSDDEALYYNGKKLSNMTYNETLGACRNLGIWYPNKKKETLKELLEDYLTREKEEKAAAKASAAGKRRAVASSSSAQEEKGNAEASGGKRKRQTTAKASRSESVSPFGFVVVAVVMLG